MALSSKQRAYIKKLAHDIDPLVRVGREGIGDNLKASVLDAIRSRELIKVKIIQTCELTAREVYDAMREWEEIELVDMIGRTIIVYKENKDKPRISTEVKKIK